jgi:hypothetical protein
MPRELVVTSRALADLLPYAKNARTHSDEQVRQIAASIREYGWTNPVLIDESDGIIAGHGRVLAAQELGETEVPTILLEGLTPSHVQAYRLADNKLALNAGWSEELLAFELQDLNAQGFALDLTGFSKMEQLEFLEWRAPGEHITPPDTPPLVQLAPVSERGAVWQLGSHRVMCGDSTVPEDVARLLEGSEKGALLHADPPYGMGKEADGIANDNLYEEKLDEFQVRWWEVWREHLEDNASVYICLLRDPQLLRQRARQHDRGVGLPPGERGGALQARDAKAGEDDRAVREVLERGGRPGLGALRRHGLDLDGRGRARPALLHHGVGAHLLRCDRAPLDGLHGARSDEQRRAIVHGLRKNCGL